jgi:hypothetical protein
MLNKYLTIYSVVCEFSNRETNISFQKCFDYITPEPIEMCYTHILNIVSNETNVPLAEFTQSYFSCVISYKSKINL